MPVTKLTKINSNAFWCMWKITETLYQIENKIVLTEDGRKEIDSISHPTKKLERLATRCCLQELVQNLKKEYKGIYKDEHDKPHLVDQNFHISITHSYPYAAAILHKRLPVGIDLEKPVEKLGRIAHRFLNDSEFADCDGDVKKLCVYWSGKEAIFKLNGKNGLNFKRDIRIAPFDLRNKDVIRSEFAIGENLARIALNYEQIDEHIISYCF